MKNLFKFLILLLSHTIFSQQFKNHRILYTNKVDSVIISTVHYQDKTTELPIKYLKDTISGLEYPVYESAKDTMFILKSKNLTKNETLSLNKILKSSKSYVRNIPLMEIYDIQIDFYKTDKIIQTVSISSYTKKIVIKNKGCETYIDNDGQEIDPCIFRGKISKKTKIYIEKLLKNKKLWSKEHFFFEDL
jgi:hypothetical protein